MFERAIAVVLLCFCAAASVAQTTPQATPHVLNVSSPTLKAGEAVPRDHTPDGRNESPELRWSNAPAATKSFAVLCEDPGVGNPPPFVHWIVYNIPATATGLPRAMPINASPLPADLAGTVQGLSGFRRAIYRGPAPPLGKVHYYHFVVYALDSTVATKPDQPPLTRAQLLEAIDGHIIGKGELVATYERTP